MTSFNHVRGDTFSVLHTLRQANQQGRNLTGYQIAATLEQRNGVVVSTLDVQLLDQSTLAGQFVLSVADSSTWPLTRLRYKVRFVDPMGNISTSGHIDVRVTTAHESGCCLAEDAVQVGVSPEIVIIEDTPDQLTVSVGTVLVGGGGGINLPIEQSDVRELPTVLHALEQADVAESQARQIAVGNLQQQIASVTTLAQTNQLNLGSKADQTDLNATNAQVELNRLAILSKADITALAMLTALVNTKADQSYVHDQIAALVGSDAQLLATIQAIADELANTEGLIDALDYTVANRVRFDIANQALTTLQKYNARTNIGAEELGTAQLLIAQITAASIGAATAAQGAKADTALQSADMAPVAFTGQFSSLAGQSGIFNVVFSAYTAGTNVVIGAADSLGTMLRKLQAQISGLAAVARTGSYNDLTNKPTIESDKVLVHKTMTRWKDRSNNGNATPFSLSLRGVFDTNFVIPANTLIAGDMYRFEMTFFLNLATTQAGGYEIAPIINNLFLPFSPTALGVSTGTINSSQTFTVIFDIIFPTVGSTGRITQNGFVLTRNAVVSFDGNFTSVDTTQDISLNYSARFSASTVGAGNAAYIKSARLYRMSDPS